MKAPYEIPDHWNPIGSARGQKAGHEAARRAKRGRGRPAGPRAAFGTSVPSEGLKPIKDEKFHPRFEEIDRAIAEGRGDKRPKRGKR